MEYNVLFDQLKDYKVKCDDVESRNYWLDINLKDVEN